MSDGRISIQSNYDFLLVYHFSCNLKIFFCFIFSSANATPEFEGRGGEVLATEISTILSRAYDNPNALDLKSLSVIPGSQCWILYVDILVSEFYFFYFIFFPNWNVLKYL